MLYDVAKWQQAAGLLLNGHHVAGYHLMVVRERSDGILGGSSPVQEPVQNEVGEQGADVADQPRASTSKSASKKKNKAASKSKKNGKDGKGNQ